MTDEVHDLDSPRPVFLDYLDSDPQLAIEEFHTFTWKLAIARPPAVLNALNPADRQDSIADLVLSCIADNFAKLRKYADVGKPFAAWLTTVLDRQVRDKLRRQGRSDRALAAIDPSPPSSQNPLPRGLLECLDVCLNQMSPKCRLYLACLADGMKPAEIALLLQLPDGSNKRVSDDMRHCIHRLRTLLLEAGVRPEEVL